MYDQYFLNPIIVTADGGIIDGQHRYAVCQMYNIEPKYIEIRYKRNELKNPEAQKEIQKLKIAQRDKLEQWFKKNKIDFRKQIDLCSSDDKMSYFYKYKDRFTSDKLYWKSLGEAYISSSNNYKYKNELNSLFNSKRPHRECLMTTEELKIYSKFSENIKIYRGMSELEDKSGQFGMSWTLKHDIAKMFATTYIHNYETISHKHIVKELVVPKKDIIAYFDGRKESEVIYMPS